MTNASELLEGTTPDEKWICASHPSSVVGWPIVSNSGRSLASLTYVPKEFPDSEAINAQSYRIGKLMAAAPDLARQVTQLEAQLRLAGNRLRVAAVNEVAKSGHTREYYEYSEWADEIDALLTQSKEPK